MKLWPALTAAALIIPGCPSPPPAPDAGPLPPSCDAGDDAFCACDQLRKLGCEEGARAECVAALRHAMSDGIVDLAPRCLAGATSKEEARTCRNSAGFTVVECR